MQALIYFCATTLAITSALSADAADPCYDNVDEATGLFANCIPVSSCSSGNIVDNACPSYPSDYVCCYDDRFPGREMRAAWIATVDNIDWPKSPDSSVATQQAELTFLIDQLNVAKINTIYFQVRPAGDALYASEIEPWSIYLTGTQGQAPEPFWDPLEFVISYCHERNIEVHAWINPYRASLTPTTDGLAENHMAIKYPEATRPFSTYLWMDPGNETVQLHTSLVVQDLVSRYDLDGIHMDDYFYPYPVEGIEFPDEELYQTYLQAGGSLAKDDWRRDNVNTLIRTLYEVTHGIKSWVRFSVSPFGIYRAGHPEGMPAPIAGFDQYSEIYCDAKLWLQSGWIDALQPQLYWKIDPPAQSYPVLLDWWVEQNTQGRHVYAGNYLSRIDEGLQDWPVEEIKNQVEISRRPENRVRGSWGNVMFSAKMIRDNVKDITDYFNTTIYPLPALTPETPWLSDENSQSIKGKTVGVKITGSVLDINLAKELDTLVHKIVIYKLTEASGWEIIKVIMPNMQSLQQVELPNGRYAIVALNRFGQESQKTFLQI